MKGFRVFIGCIPGDSCEHELACLLSQYATIEKVNLARDINRQNVQYCLGYGFVICPTKDDKKALLSISTPLFYRDRQITLKEYKSGKKLKEEKESFNLRRLFIGNIPSHVSNQYLQLVLSRFGEVEAVYSVDQSAQRMFKFGYVVYLSIESASLVLKHKEEVIIDGTKLRLEYFNGKNLSGSNALNQQYNGASSEGYAFQSMALSNSAKGSKNVNVYGNYPELTSLKPKQNTGYFKNQWTSTPKEHYIYSTDSSSKIIENASIRYKLLYPLIYDKQNCDILSEMIDPTSNYNNSGLVHKNHIINASSPSNGLQNLAIAGLSNLSKVNGYRNGGMVLDNEVCGGTSRNCPKDGGFEFIPLPCGDFSSSSNPINDQIKGLIQKNHSKGNIRINKQKKLKFSNMKRVSRFYPMEDSTPLIGLRSLRNDEKKIC